MYELDLRADCIYNTSVHKVFLPFNSSYINAMRLKESLVIVGVANNLMLEEPRRSTAQAA